MRENEESLQEICLVDLKNLDQKCDVHQSEILQFKERNTMESITVGHNILPGDCKLDDRNYAATYPIWKFRVRAILQNYGLWNIVDGKELRPESFPSDTKSEEVKVWTQRDHQAFYIITMTIKDSQIWEIYETQSAKEAWDKLAKKYENLKETREFILKEKLEGLQFKKGTSIESHFGMLKRMMDEYKYISGKLDNFLRLRWILRSLPPSFKFFKSNIYILQNLSFDEIKNLAMKEEMHQMYDKSMRNNGQD